MNLLTLAAVVIALGCGQAWAQSPRCTALVIVRTSDLAGQYSLQSGETAGVQTIEGKGDRVTFCDERHTCYPAKDLDLVTPCSVKSIQNGVVTVR